MKILQVFNRYNEKGGEELSVERVSNATSVRHHVFHCYFDSRPLLETVGILNRALQALQMFYNPKAVKSFERQLQACSPDIILFHNIFPVGSIGVYLAALRSGIPVLHYIHNFRPYSVNGYLWANEKLETAGLRKNFIPEILAGSWQNSRTKTAIYACVLWTMHAMGVYRRLNGWLAISEFMRDVFVNAGVPKEKVFLLRHSWDSREAIVDFQTEPSENAPPYVLFLGRITSAKGIKILLEAWHQVVSTHPDGRLVIGGDGPEAEWLVAEIKNLQRVEFRGFVSGDEKRRLLRGCRAMIVPSEWWEPLGLVVYEAYQYGRPVIATGSGGLLETVKDQETGWLYHAGDTRALAACMLEALINPDEATLRGRRGFQWMETHSQNSVWLEDFEKITGEVISLAGQGHAMRPADHPEKPITFSIVTASFQQVPYLARCAASVADQGGGFVVEHLVQDGNSGSEFDQWAETQSFASCISEADGGMYDAINRGFLRSKGEYLAWLNCDEQYLPGALAKVKAWFDAHPDVDILFGDVVLVTPEGVPLAYRKAVTPQTGHIRNCFLPTYSAATFVRRKVIDSDHLIDTTYRAIADGVWIDSLLAAGFKTGVINQPLAVFTQTGSNLGQSELAHSEKLDWQEKLGKWHAFKAPLWSGLHRIRKVFAGCYRTRKVQVRTYGPRGNSRRIQQAIVGERWVTGLSSEESAFAKKKLGASETPASKNTDIPLRLSVYLADQNPKSGRSLGISRMTEVILRELSARKDLSLYGISSRSSIQMPPGTNSSVVPWSTRTNGPRLLTDHLHPLWKIGTRHDICYFPKGFLPRLYHLCKPSVVTIHDTIIQYYSDHYPEWRTETEYRYWANMLKHTLRHADCILTVSESAKLQIETFMARHGIPEKKIHVTYEPCLYESYPQPVAPPKADYVLHLGSREPHKRTSWLIKEWEKAGKHLKHLPNLHVVGTIPSDVEKLAREAPNIVCLPFLNDDALRTQFSTAKALVLPSEIEGFGLPAIEAYYLGTPVCYTLNTSIEEVLKVVTRRGGFGLENPASLFAALDDVMSISPAEIYDFGIKLRETYASASVAERMMEVFRETVDQYRRRA